MVARVNRDDEAWMGQTPSRSFVPLLALAAAASAAIVLYAIGDWALAAGFAAIEDRSVRQALTQLVEVLSRAA